MTMTNPFAAPAAASDGVKWEELNGSLLIIKPTAAETGIKTSYGESEAVRADVYAIDGPQAGSEHADTLVFPKILQSQLKPRIGQVVIGRLGQGNAKPGQSAPWILQDATDADIQTGVAAWEKIQQGQFTAPAAPQAPAPQQRWGQPQPQQAAAPQQGGFPF